MCIFIRRQKCCTTAFNFSTSQNELTRLLWETLAQRSLHFYKDNTLSKPVDEFIWNFLVVRDGFGAIFWKKPRSAYWKKKNFESNRLILFFVLIILCKWRIVYCLIVGLLAPWECCSYESLHLARPMGWKLIVSDI